MLEAQGLREAVDLGVDQPDAGAVAPDGEHAQPASRRRGDHLVGKRIVGRDHRGAVRRDDALEQDQLRVEIGSLGRVIVHVVAREVGEAADRHAARRRCDADRARAKTPPSRDA